MATKHTLLIILGVVLLALAVAVGIWTYNFVLPQRNAAQSVQGGSIGIPQAGLGSTNVAAIPTSTVAAGGQYNVIYPQGDAAQVLGAGSNQFKVQYVGVATVPVSLRNSDVCNDAPAYINQYFLQPSGLDANGNTWCYPNLGLSTANNNPSIYLVVLSADILGTQPNVSLSYPLFDTDTGTSTYVVAQVPEDAYGGSWLQFTPVGSVYPTGRIGFPVPTNATQVAIDYPGGELRVDLQNKTVTLAPGSLVGNQAPIAVIPTALSAYDSINNYLDQTGSFSMEYPVALTPNGSSEYGSNYLDDELAEFDAPGSGWMLSSNLNSRLSDIAVDYAADDISAAGCDDTTNHGANSQQVVVNGTPWYLSSSYSGASTGGSATADDEYQIYDGGVCFGLDFTWLNQPGVPPNWTVMQLFEESELGTFRIVNPSALNSTEYGNGN